MSPKVSIIVPCYNQAAYLPKAIASLQAQTLEDWECIIVDDGSTDNSAEIAANAALKDQRFRLIQKLNGGSASARNMGLTMTKGEYIQFLDADDYLDEEKLEKQSNLMRSQNADMSYTAFKHTYSDGTTSKPLFVQLKAITVMTRWGLGGSIPPHAFLYRASFIQNIHLEFDERCRFREDWNWLIHCFNARPKTVILPEYCGAYYAHNESSKTSSYIKMQSGNFAFMAYMAGQLQGRSKCLWVLRISEELWIWMLRMVKYRSTSIAKTIAPLVLHTGYLLAAILLMPLSFWPVLIYFIKTYIAK